MLKIGFDCFNTEWWNEGDDKRHVFTVKSKKKLSCSNVSPKEQMLLHANSKVLTIGLPWKLLHVLIEHSNKLDIFIGKTAHTARMFRHGEMVLSPHARRNTRHHNRTRRGNSSFPFHFVFRIGSCVLSTRGHISSWSGTRDTTPIRGLNHGWNRAIVTPLDHDVIVLLTLALCCSLHIVLGIELRHQFGNTLLLDVASFLHFLRVWGHQLPIPKKTAASSHSKQRANPNVCLKCWPDFSCQRCDER